MKTTVMIATRNRAAQLELTLESFARLYLQSKFSGVRFLVVDDGSTDETPDLLKEFGSLIEVHRIEREGGYRKNPSAVLNLGHRLADSDIVIEQGAEVVHLTDCITPLVEACRPGVIALARVFNGDVARMEAERYFIKGDCYHFPDDVMPDRVQTNGDLHQVPESGMPPAQIYCGAERQAPFQFLGATHRHDFDAIGGYDEQRSRRNDEDYANRMQARGVRFNFLGRAIGFHLRHGKS